MDQGPNIPEEYRLLTVTQAYTIMCIPKATFYRNHLNDTAKPGKRISKRLGEDEKEYIPSDEMLRVFGQEFLRRLHKYMGEPVDASQKKSSETNDTPDELTVTIPQSEYIRLKVKAELADEFKAERDKWHNQAEQAQRLLIAATPEQPTPEPPWWKRLFSNNSHPPPERERA